MLTFTAAWALSGPESMNFAIKNWLPATSFQPDGTCQLGLPSDEPVLAAAGAAAETFASPIGGWEDDNPGCAERAGKFTVLRKSMKAVFCWATSASSPVILKNHVRSSRGKIAARMRSFSPDPGLAPACSYILQFWPAIWTG